nr:hypothetical protein [Tanacetum cinerariifolium]
MSLTFADTHNMVAYLNKSDASEGFNQVIDFLNGSYIKYDLTVNPHIYVSCIKQFWNTAVVKQTNDVTRLQALVDRKKVVILEAAIRDILCLDDAEGVDCLHNEEIFAELARMGRKFNFSKYIFESLVRNVDITSKFYMYPRFIQLILRNQLGHASSRVIEGEGNAEEQVQDIADDAAAQEADTTVIGDDVQEQSIPSPTPPTPPSQQPQDLRSTSQLKRRVKKMEKGNRVKVLKLRRLKKVRTSQRIDTLDDTVMEDASNQERMIDDLDARVALMDDKEEEEKAGEIKVSEDKPTEVQEVVDVVTTAKLITEVVTAASESVTTASITISAAEPQAPTTTITDIPSKDKGKGIMVEEPKPLKKKQQVEMDEEFARKLHEELNKDIDWDMAIEHVKKKAKEDPAVQRYQVIKKRPQIEAQARKNMIMYLKNVTGFRLDYFKGIQEEEVEDLNRHLEIVPDEDDDVYTEATLLARKIDKLKSRRVRGLSMVKQRKYLLSRFTLGQILNAVRLRVEEQSEMSLELLSFGVDAAMDLKEKHQVFNAAGEELSAVKQKLMLLD